MTLVRRLISLFGLSKGLVECICRQCAFGNVLYDSTLSSARSISSVSLV